MATRTSLFNDCWRNIAISPTTVKADLPQNENAPDSNLSLGTLAEQTSPEICSTDTIRPGSQRGNGSDGLLLEVGVVSVSPVYINHRGTQR